MKKHLDNFQEKNDDLAAYVNMFIENADKQLENGNIELLMFYDRASAISDRQFLHFKNCMNTTFDGNIDWKVKRARQVTDRIFPVERRSELGHVLFDESLAWSKKKNDPGVKLVYDPMFLDFKTHEIRLVGFHDGKDLRKLLKTMHRQERKLHSTSHFYGFVPIKIKIRTDV